MASSWKLTKKLKETSFLKSHGSSSSDDKDSNNHEKPSRSQVRDTLVASGHPNHSSQPSYSALSSNRSTLNSDSNNTRTNTLTKQAGSYPASIVSGANGASGPNGASGTSAASSRNGTATANTHGIATGFGSNAPPGSTGTTGATGTTGTTATGTTPHTSHTIHSSALGPESKSELPSTSTSSNPGLLRVRIYEFKHLEIPQQYIPSLPSWCMDPSSTRPPPVYLVLEYDKTQILLCAISGTVQEPVWDKLTTFDVSVNYKHTPLSISAYLRLKEKPQNEDQKPCVKDVLLGSSVVQASDLNKKCETVISKGLLTVKCELHNTKNQPLSIDDFSLLKVVGKGSFGKVMQVRKNDTRQIYALKTIRKAHIISKCEVSHTMAERTVLAKINNPFIVPLKFSFQSKEKLYLVLAFVNGGELFHHLQREGPFDLNRARFYTAELLCALECLHEFNVIYRDLKPENILIDYTGHISLCDFGLCKLNMGSKDETTTFCGTPEYLAPELLVGQGYTKAVDWWTLGVLFYEMLTGLPPFFDQNTNTMYHKIVKDPLKFPADMDREAKSLITGLLNRDPKQRLGANGAAEIKAHPFFNQIDWKFLLNKKYAAPFLPAVSSAFDTSNFDSEFTSEVPMDSVVEKTSILSDSVQDQFKGWSFTNDSKLAGSAKW